MKKIVLIAATIALTGSLTLFANPYAGSTHIKVGDALPEISGQTLAGDELSPEKLEGKVVVLNFFATWCGPCMKELPHLEKAIFNPYKDREDFALFVIGREHTEQELNKWKKEKTFTMPLVPDPKREIYSQFADKYIPRNFVIDRNGTVIYESIGYSEKRFEELISVVKKAMDSES